MAGVSAGGTVTALWDAELPQPPSTRRTAAATARQTPRSAGECTDQSYATRREKGLWLAAVLPARHVAAGAVAVALIAACQSGAHASSGTRDPSFPKPPRGATVFGRQLGDDALALAVVPRGKTALLVQASVVGRQGNGLQGLRLAFTVAGHRKVAAACAPGCYRASFSPAAAPRAVDVEAPGLARPWHVELPAAWPPHSAAFLVARTEKVWRALHSLTFHETLGSGVGQVVASTWRVQAPDRLAYQVQGGWAGVVIGARRWDRAPGATRWQPSAQTPLHQPVPFWVSVTDAHVLGAVTYHGRPAVRVSFFDPGSPAWFTLVIDPKTSRTLDSHMVTNAHFMHDTYESFDTTPAIVPPR